MSTNEAKSEQLRLAGNRKYTDKDYKGAIKCYQEAIALTPNDAALPSNTAAAFYELGVYDKCLVLSQKVLELIEQAGEDPKNLRRKNLIRLSKIYYMVSRRKDLKAFVKSTFKPSDLEDKSDDNKELLVLHESIQAYIKNKNAVEDSGDIFSYLPRLHPSKTPSVREYYTYGHDGASSLLFHVDERSDDRDTKGIRIAKNPDLSFFYAGCGDSRNIMMTLSDINRQITSGGPAMNLSNTKVHIVMNDILASCIARDILIYVICEELGTYKFEEIRTNKDAANLAALLYYIYISVVMPETLYAIMIKMIEKLITQGDTNTLPKWIYMSNETWMKVRQVYKFWIGKDFYVSTRWLLNRFTPEIDSSFMDEVEDQIRNDDYKLGQKLGMENKDKLALPVPLDNHIMKRLKILYPPEECDGGVLQPKLKLMMQELMRNGKISDKKSLTEDLIKHWKPNVTCIDEKWNVNNTASNLQFNPLEVVNNLFYKKWFALKLKEMISKTKSKLPPPTLFDFFIPDFYQCGQCISGLGSGNSRLVMEFDVNEMHQTLSIVRDKKHRESRGFPTTFDRIHLSNVTDHTGYITAFTEFAQILKRKEYSCICFAILLNVSFWRDINELAYSYTGIQSLSDFPKYVGFKKLYGDLLSEYTYWQPIDNPKELATKEEITQWVFNLFINIALPATLVPTQTCVINAPNNLSNIFKILTRLNEIGYPIHWLTSIIESFLCGTISTTATVPTERVIKYIRKSVVKKYYIMPWQLELSTLSSLWCERHKIRAYQPNAIFKIPPPGQIKHFQIPIDMIKEFIPFSGGSILTATLLACIEYPTIPDKNKFARFNPMDFTSRELSTDDSIRKQLVDWKHSNWMQILSVLIWNDLTNMLEFWMDQEVLNNLQKQGCNIVVFRNDSWKVISQPTPLSKASIVVEKDINNNNNN